MQYIFKLLILGPTLSFCHFFQAYVYSLPYVYSRLQSDYDIQALDHTKGDFWDNWYIPYVNSDSEHSSLFLFDTSVALTCILRGSKDQSEFWPEETNKSHTSGKQLWFTFDAQHWFIPEFNHYGNCFKLRPFGKFGCKY